jgi:hypothetical protein
VQVASVALAWADEASLEALLGDVA